VNYGSEDPDPHKFGSGRSLGENKVVGIFLIKICKYNGSVADPDPYVFGLSGSGFISQ
jgi:hypothetical protein